jgi:serine/threonine protein kinase
MELDLVPLPFPPPVILKSTSTVGRSERSILKSESSQSYTLIRRICETAVLNGEIWIANANASAANVVMKIYPLVQLNQIPRRTSEDPLKEVSVMQSAGFHPNCINLLEACQDGQFLYIIMEEGGSDMLDFINTVPSLSNSDCIVMFKDILAGVQHLHQRGIAHCDLSLENILVSGIHDPDSPPYTCKIIDFGMAIHVPEELQQDRCNKIRRQEWFGKMSYNAPEAFLNDYVNHMQCDIWSLGVILFALLTRTLPFGKAMEPDERYRLVAGGFLPELVMLYSQSVDLRAIDLLGRMLQPDPDTRATVTEVAGHAWLA